jgi:hypothetical protein
MDDPIDRSNRGILEEVREPAADRGMLERANDWAAQPSMPSWEQAQPM